MRTPSEESPRPDSPPGSAASLHSNGHSETPISTSAPPHHGERNLPPAPPEMTAPQRRFFTFRATLLGLLLLPFVVYWATEQGVDIILSLTVPPVSMIMGLLLLNWPLRRWLPRLALREGELVLIFGMLSVGCAISAEWSGNITPLIYSFALFADNNNRSETVILPYVSHLFFIKDKSVLTGFREGGHSLHFMLAHMGPWWTPILMWTFFVSLMALAMLFICSLFRPQWTEREKLTFPVIQLPVALTAGAGDSPFWRSGYMWGAFAVMFAIDMLNGFSFLYPGIPSINVRFIGDLSQAFPDPPFNAVGWTPIGIFPFITAMAMFLPSDLLFSAIFFFFFRKGEQVVAASFGHPQGVFGGGWLVPAAPYFSEQSWGAFLGLFFMAIWIARNYLKEVWASIKTGKDLTGAEMVPHRWAFAGLVGCVMGLLFLGTLMQMNPLFTLLYLALFFAFSIALTRMRAELGPPTHEMAFMGPNQLIVDFAGTKVIPPEYFPNLAAQFHFANRIHRSHPMPPELEAMKMAERPRMVSFSFFAAIAFAIVAASLTAHLMWIYHGYRWGAARAGDDVASVVTTLRNTPRNPNPAAIGAVFAGMAMVFGLNSLRFTLPSFPLNPVGYALGMNFGVDYFWFGLLIAFLVKTGTQRYGGLKAYRKLHLMALGVMLAEYGAETIWAVVAMTWRIATYSISINGRLGWNQ